MSKIYQGIIYFNDKPIYDIILKASNEKIALWYLIRLYYEKERKDLFETYLFVKVKNLLLSKQDYSFPISYSKFICTNKTLLSTLLYMMSNDIITLSEIYKWTTEFNTIYNKDNIIITERLIFDTNKRMFDKDIKLSDVNFYELSNPSYLQYKMQKEKKLNKLIYRHNEKDNSFINKYLSDNKIENEISKTYKPPVYKPYKHTSDNLPKSPLTKYFDAKINDTSILDKYKSWNSSLQLTKYNRRSSYPYYSNYITDKKKKK